MLPVTPPSPPSADAAQSSLVALRARIDEIDAEVHELLIARSQIIEALVRVKKTVETGAAFRPGREAAMMHALVERHRGGLPLVTVEHLWREIISTFTWLQANFKVFVSAADAAETRDIARFYFGFTVPFETSMTPVAAIEAVERSVSDLAVVRLGASPLAWWRGLGEGNGPRIIARLPFLEIADRPVATPAVVISNRLADPVEPEIFAFAITGTGDNDALTAAGGQRIAWLDDGSEAVITLPAGDTATDAARRIGSGARWIGGHARPVSCPPRPTAPNFKDTAP